LIDPKLLRTDPEAVARNLARRGYPLDVTALKTLEEKRKPWQVEVDRLRAERNVNAKAVGAAKGRGEDVSALIAKGESLTAGLGEAEAALAAVQAELEHWQLGLPNLLHASVPDGHDESANLEVRRWGEPRHFAFQPRDHVEVGERLAGLDFEAAARISGARFVVMLPSEPGEGEAYSGVIREAQELVEIGLKGVLGFVGVEGACRGSVLVHAGAPSMTLTLAGVPASA